MDPFVVATLVLALALAVALAWARRLRRDLARARSSRQSLATRHGLNMEQFAPFLAAYPFDPRGFRFIGNPVDGVQFEADRVVFVELKTGKARLSDSQQAVRALVEAGRVEWRTVRVDAATPRPHDAVRPRT